ncbi:Ig-like domain repeat protein [Demequina gelatinilytica]|uniref:Ig-like domain repeat protein n=1 Tax=Demequina gelatinilytica TaxID=1638980 RepID=UPI000782580B|nr:Ig-like domain repeat protein [Demequina gelatinilytica]
MRQFSIHRHVRGLAAVAVASALTVSGLSAAQAAEDGVETVEGYLVRTLSAAATLDTAGEVEETFIVDSETDEMIPVTVDGSIDVDFGTAVVADVDTGTGEILDIAPVDVRVAKVNATGVHRAYVLTVGNGTYPAMSLDDARQDLVDSADYWVAQSRGTISSFDVAAAATATHATPCMSYTKLWTYAKSQFPGIDFDADTNHLVVYTPEACADGYGYAGIATVPSGTLAGGLIHIASAGITVTAHEIGHNLGLGHASVRVATLPGYAEELEYYGIFSIQGGAFDGYTPPALDAAWRDYLGLDGYEYQALEAELDPMLPDELTVTLNEASSTSGLTAVKLTDPASGEETFVEYRGAGGYDATAFYASASPYLEAVDGRGGAHYLDYTPGVVISELDRDYAELTFLTQEGASDWDMASLLASETYTDPDGAYAVTVTSLSDSTAQLTIRTGTLSGIAQTSTKVSVPAVYQGTVPQAKVVVTSGTTPTGKVTVYVDGVKHATSTLNDAGKTWVKLPADLAVGSHTVRAVYAGSEQHATSSAKTGARVNAKITSSATASAPSVPYGTQAKVTVSIPAAKGYGGKVTLTQGTRTWSKAVNPATGKVSLWMPAGWKPGTRTVEVRYSGTAEVKAARTSVSVVTIKAAPTVRVPSATNVKVGRRATLDVVVSGPLDAYERGTVQAYVDGKAVTSQVSLTRSGTRFVATLRTTVLPEGRLSIRYTSKNAYLKSKVQRTRYVVK